MEACRPSTRAVLGQSVEVRPGSDTLAMVSVFCGAVEYTDHQVDRIVEAIEQKGEIDNTLIIYIAGDNGPTPEGGLHGTNNKCSYFN